jgi:uncharacterized membrane protein YphA (DoxX/SURF4 family)
VQQIFSDILDKKSLIICLRIIVGGFFILTGVIKLTLPVEEVQNLIRTFEILPNDLTYTAALILPWIELLPGLFLLIGVFPLVSVRFIIGLTLIFILVLISVLIRGLAIEDCGCLGGWIQETPTFALWRDIVIILLSLPIHRFYMTALANNNGNTIDKS